jgi:putative ABC transport system permease protein
LSLGLRERDAALEVARPSAAQALVPPLDQTRTVGLVTLPGAFVGVLIGSGDPVQAGAAQVLVLIGLLAAESVAVVMTLELVARGWISRPADAPDANPTTSERRRRRLWSAMRKRVTG